MVSKNTAGFTLIETTIAMTISASLAVIALFGFSSLRGNAEFSSGIDALKESMTAIRTEAYSTVNTNAAGNSSDVVLGRLLTFTYGQPTVKVDKIIAPDTGVSGTLPVSVTIVPNRTITLEWGIIFTGGVAGQKVQVAMFRSPLDGSNVTTYSGVGGFSPVDYATISAVPASKKSFQFVDPDGRNAFIDVDPANNSISRRFQ